MRFDRIALAQPKTADEVEALRDDINALLPLFTAWDEDFVDWLKTTPQSLTIVYDGDTPIGYIRLDDHDVGKKALELRGCLKKPYRASGLMQALIPAAIRRAFDANPHKRHVLASAPDGAREIQHAIVSFGFRRIGRTADKEILYKMERRDCLQADPSPKRPR